LCFSEIHARTFPAPLLAQTGPDSELKIGILPLMLKSMPIYEYELCEGECKVCSGRFSIRRPLSRPELTQCPLCRKAVRKVISTVNSPTKLKPLSVSEAKNAGFTVLKRVGKGEYERQ
jgi:putative FmdB family regulatory protein